MMTRCKLDQDTKTVDVPEDILEWGFGQIFDGPGSDSRLTTDDLVLYAFMFGIQCGFLDAQGINIKEIQTPNLSSEKEN